jgi:hypothetical protein
MSLYNTITMLAYYFFSLGNEVIQSPLSALARLTSAQLPDVLQPRKESQSHKMKINTSYSPIFTGKPGGSFIRTNSLSLLKCLKGAITSSTFSNISTDSGKSGL